MLTETLPIRAAARIGVPSTRHCRVFTRCSWERRRMTRQHLLSRRGVPTPQEALIAGRSPPPSTVPYRERADADSSLAHARASR